MSRTSARPRGIPAPAIIGALCAVIAAHRLILWWIFGGRIDAVASANPDWLTWQYLNLAAYIDHLAPALWYLQQTPPLPHVIFGLIAKNTEWPVGVARCLYVLQAVISAATASILFLLLRRLRCGAVAGVLACLWFGLSSDLYVLELNSLGQLFYESGAMLFAVAACHGLVTAYQRRSDGSGAATRLAFGVGTLVALCALTRASFSLFFVPVIGFAAPFLGLRRTAIMLVPLLLLHGGWSLKTGWVYGYVSPNTSSWAGINATVGLDDAMQADFVRSIEDGAGGVAPWVVKLMKDRGYVAWSTPIPGDLLPDDIVRQQQRIQDAMGGTNNPENSVAIQKLSFEYLKALKPFASQHLGAFWTKFLAGYEVFWQPIANYSSMFVGPVSTLARQHAFWTRAPFSLVRSAQAMSGTFPDVAYAPVRLPALSLDIVDAVCFWSLHLLLPLLLLHDAIMLALRKARVITPEMLLLALTVVYGGVLFNAVELGENMRFRLSIEPEIIALSAATLLAAASALRAAGAGLRLPGSRATSALAQRRGASGQNWTS